MKACLYLLSHGRACSDLASARSVIRLSIVVSPPNRPRWVHRFTFKEVVILARDDVFEAALTSVALILNLRAACKLNDCEALHIDHQIAQLS